MSVGASVVDCHHHFLSIVTICNLHFRAHGKRGVSSRHSVGVEAGAAGSGLTVIAIANAIVTGLAARQNSRFGRGAAKQQKGN